MIDRPNASAASAPGPSLIAQALDASKMISFDSPTSELEAPDEMSSQAAHQRFATAETRIASNDHSDESKLLVESHGSVSLFGGLHQRVLQDEGDRKLIQNPSQTLSLQRSTSSLEEVIHIDSSDDEDDHRMLINPTRRYKAL